MPARLTFIVIMAANLVAATAFGNEKLYCQSQMAQAAESKIGDVAKKIADGKPVEIFSTSTSSGDNGWLAPDVAESLMGVKVKNGVSYGTVTGTFFVGARGSDRIQYDFEASVYLRSGTCEVLRTNISKSELKPD